MTTITLDGIEFADWGISGWVFSGLTDWFGQTANKIGVTERPQAHGAFVPSRALRSSRAISFEANYLGETVEEVESAWDDLAAVGAEGPVAIRVDAPSGATERLVTVSASQMTDHHGDPTGRVAVDMIAYDPRRYAVGSLVPWEQTGPPTAGGGLVWPAVWPLVWPDSGSPGRIVLTNSGKAPSAPQLRLLGGFSSALITCAETGDRIGLDRFVPQGSVVTLDTEQHRATIDGQSDVSRWLRWREWSLVPPGESRTFQFDAVDPVGEPKLQGRVLSAWW